MAASMRIPTIRFVNRYLKHTSQPHLLYSWHLFSSDSKTELVRVDKQEGLQLIGINRPEKRNCVNPATASQLKTAFQNFAEDDEASVAVLYGIGGTFCAGYDLQEVAAANTAGLSLHDGPMGPTKMSLKKPVIAAVDGYAVAGGLELALWCDLRVMEESAVVGVFCRRFGVPLIDGGTVRLPKLIGLARALDLILTGRGVNAKEAYEMGLVNKVCKKGKALETAVNLAKVLYDVPQAGLKIDKFNTLRGAYDARSMEEALRFEIENARPILKEAAKGALKFLQGEGRHGKGVRTEN